MQKILQQIFTKNNLQEIPVETLQQVTQEFPYFAVGQYLLTKKLSETGNPDYEKQFQKTLTYFHNPLWLQHQLLTAGDAAETAATPDNELTATPTHANDELVVPHPDLMDEVVLHQEADFSDAGIVETSEPAAPVHVAVKIEPEKQTIQREEPFTFQAFYTVDYFASQGIKLNQDTLQQDKLGKQLKSFTEWLKTMRRLPETAAVEVLDKINDGEIAQIAAHSLVEKEVLTEAMADVLVKQGKYEKARALYNKLSLLNPHKTSYFAAKIEELK